MNVRFIGGLAAAFASLAALAQAPPPATPAGGAGSLETRSYISAAEVADMMKRTAATAKPGPAPAGGPLLHAGPFTANMEYRTATGNAAVHENDAELFVVIDGSGTMVLGGTLVNPTRNGTNLSGASSQGGTAHRLAKGDMVLVPENTAHWVSQVDNGRLVLMSIHLPRPAPAGAAPAPAPAR